jgi:Tetratricopeptide repeat.
MDTQQYDKAIEAYKEALRRNPTDDETRYNLALAIKLNKRPPQQGGGGGGGRSPQPNQPQTPPDNQPPRQPQGQEPTLDKSQADHILDALRQEEQHTRQRINQQNSQQNQPNKKNW